MVRLGLVRPKVKKSSRQLMARQLEVLPLGGKPAQGRAGDQLVLIAVSSTTKEVCSETSSVPVNFTVTVLPAKLPSE